jgi:hypothetical protein
MKLDMTSSNRAPLFEARVRIPGDSGWDVPRGGGWAELEESGATDVADTAAAHGESKVATGWLPTWD